MTVNEAAGLIAKIKAYYPSWKAENLKATAVAWTEVFGATNYEDAKKALLIYERQGKEYAPNPGQLMKIIEKYKPKSKNPLEMLNDIKYALRNATYGAEEEFKRLPKAAQMAVGSPNELRRISHAGLDSYTENNLLKRLEETADVMETRSERMGIEQTERLGIESA